MIKLDEYKKHLIDEHKYLIDNSDLKRKERLVLLGIKYPDIKLQEIINNSYAFVRDVLSSKTAEQGYASFYLEDDLTDHIELGLMGGTASDTLFVDHAGRTISKYIVESALGKDITMQVIYEELPLTTSAIENGLEPINFLYRLYIEGLPKDLTDLKAYYFGEHTEVNKLVRDNIPHMLEAEGKEVEARTLNDKEYIDNLVQLLTDKGEEITSATSKEQVLDLLGDISDLSSAVASHYGYCLVDVLTQASKKTGEQGGYQKRTFLEGTVKKHN